jgi:hypothetical protein
LALEQAAAYMEATGLSPAEYLARFRARRAALLARGEPLGCSKTVASTWSVALGQLERFAPLAVGLLRLLACCAPEAVPLPLLLRPHPGLSGQLAVGVAPALVSLLEDPLEVHDAIGALRQYSLVTLAGDDSVSVSGPFSEAVPCGQGVGVFRAEGPGELGQQRGELVAGAGRVAGLPRPVSGCAPPGEGGGPAVGAEGRPSVGVASRAGISSRVPDTGRARSAA